MTFPVLAIDPKGFTWLLRSDSDTHRMPIACIGIYKKRAATLEFFDSGGELWRLEGIASAKPVSLWRRLFSAIEETEVIIRFREEGTYSADRIKAALESAVRMDDDFLTQFEDESRILTRLAGAESISDVFRTYRWMRKDFTKRPNKAPEPTTTAVTPPAAQEPRQP